MPPRRNWVLTSVLINLRNKFFFHESLMEKSLLKSSILFLNSMHFIYYVVDLVTNKYW